MAEKLQLIWELIWETTLMEYMFWGEKAPQNRNPVRGMLLEGDKEKGIGGGGLGVQAEWPLHAKSPRLSTDQGKACAL